MFEKRKVTVTLIDLICLFLGRVVLWFGITLLVGLVLKGIVNVVMFMATVLTSVWPVILIFMLMLCMVVFLMKDDRKVVKKQKENKKSSLRKSYTQDLVFIDLDTL